MLMGTRLPESAVSSTRLEEFTLIFLALSFLTVHFYTNRANTLIWNVARNPCFGDTWTQEKPCTRIMDLAQGFSCLLECVWDWSFLSLIQPISHFSTPRHSSIYQARWANA